MTTTPKTAEEQYDLACEALRMGGLKLTPNRRYVLQKMIGEQGPHSVQSLLDAAGPKSNLDQSTIYRTLESFEQFGLIQQVMLSGSRQTFFEWKQHGHHYHVVCKRCRKVAHIELFERDFLNAKASKASGFSGVDHHLEFLGVCSECQSQAD